MTEQEYQKYKQITQKICKGDERWNDLLHDVLIQLAENKKFNEMEEKQRVYFFVRAITNQFYSHNSYFYRQYKQKNFFINIDERIEIPEVDYKEPYTIEWVEERLADKLNDNPDDWYDIGIFRLYMEHKKLEKLHRKTQIPKYSLRETIKSMKNWLRQEWDRLN